jgi:lipopolysaccharide/colanic/teichoic acid biosynthesis glycosyltransferase
MTAPVDMTRTRSHADDGIRRAGDVALSVAGLALLSPLLLAVAVCVRCSSPGPVLFSQERVGKDGRRFRILKFRSMKLGSQGPSVTSVDDGRVTGVGRRLRAWKVDELPQLFNVLRGDMSFIGPRPEVPGYVERYTDAEREVLSVRPGMTGVCQLAYRHEERLLQGCADPEEVYLTHIMPAKLALDLHYIRHRTLWSDLGILFRTIRALVVREAEGGPDRRPFEQTMAAARAVHVTAPMAGAKGGSTPPEVREPSPARGTPGCSPPEPNRGHRQEGGASLH